MNTCGKINEEKCSVQPFLNGEQIAEIIQKAICDKSLTVQSQS
jgi:hypothetical protein